MVWNNILEYWIVVCWPYAHSSTSSWKLKLNMRICYLQLGVVTDLFLEMKVPPIRKCSWLKECWEHIYNIVQCKIFYCGGVEWEYQWADKFIFHKWMYTVDKEKLINCCTRFVDLWAFEWNVICSLKSMSNEHILGKFFLFFKYDAFTKLSMQRSNCTEKFMH